MAGTGDNPEFSMKAKGVTVVKKIVYGNIAKSFGRKREDDGHTHQWTIYLKPFENEDMSLYIKKVHFKLHESYANQNRIVTAPPYEVTETGWGEFEIVIKIWFNDPNERPVTVYHVLKLFATPGEISKKDVVSECYDELVFHEPSVALQRMLTQAKLLPGSYVHPTDFEGKTAQLLSDISTANGKVHQEIVELKNKLNLAKATTAKFKEELEKAQNIPVSS